MAREQDHPPQSPYATGLRGACPRCGQGRLFIGFLTVNRSCPVCGLDLEFADSGDGPAVFVIMLAGFVIVALALWVEIAFQPAIWVHLAIFLPLTVLVCAAMLRPLKGVMIALQYHNRAAEGRLEK